MCRRVLSLVQVALNGTRIRRTHRAWRTRGLRIPECPRRYLVAWDQSNPPKRRHKLTMQYVYMNTNTTPRRPLAATQEAPASVHRPTPGRLQVYGAKVTLRCAPSTTRASASGAGEFTAIIPSTRKSTMMHIRLDAPTSGHVFVEDTDITALKDTS